MAPPHLETPQMIFNEHMATPFFVCLFVLLFNWMLQNECAIAAIVAACGICFMRISCHAVNGMFD